MPDWDIQDPDYVACPIQHRNIHICINLGDVAACYENEMDMKSPSRSTSHLCLVSVAALWSTISSVPVFSMASPSSKNA